jgi:hypothetical protein
LNLELLDEVLQGLDAFLETGGGGWKCRHLDVAKGVDPTSAWELFDEVGHAAKR